MKSIAELAEIRKRTLERINLRHEDKQNEVRIVVGMATCGIAAGARPVMMAFLDEISRRHLSHVTVTQTGCIGMCRLEPMAEVYLPDQEKVTYVNLNEEKARRIILEHVVNGHPATSYTIGNADESLRQAT